MVRQRSLLVRMVLLILIFSIGIRRLSQVQSERLWQSSERWNDRWRQRGIRTGIKEDSVGQEFSVLSKRFGKPGAKRWSCRSGSS